MNNFKNKLWFYSKDAIINYAYLITGGFLAFIISFFTKDGTFPDYVCTILSAINIIVYAFVVFIAYMKTGGEALVKKHSNDVERRHILETRQYHEIDKVGEHNKKNPLIFSLIMVVPLFILLLVRIILDLCKVQALAYTSVIKTLYGLFYTFFYGISHSASVYFIAIGLVIFIFTAYFGYYLGVKNSQKTYDKAERLKKRIEGEKN